MKKNNFKQLKKIVRKPFSFWYRVFSSDML